MIGLTTFLATAAAIENLEAVFENFASNFGRHYMSGDEKKLRKSVFAQNLEYIEKENAKEHPWSLGVTKFADWTHEEFRSMLESQEANSPTSLWGAASKKGTYAAAASNVTLPDAVDWEKKGKVARVKDQGHCGGGWAFAAAAALESAIAITGKTAVVDLSVQSLLDCSYLDSRCKGGVPANAFSYVERWGICTEASDSFKCVRRSSDECTSSTCPMTWTSTNCTLGVRPSELKSYTIVRHNDITSLESALANQPVAVAIEAHSQVFQFYTGGVLTSLACGRSVDHVVLAVGYGTDNKGVGFWKAKNSWGSDWGEDGYMRLARDIDARHGGICGVLLSETYPTVGDGETTITIVA